MMLDIFKAAFLGVIEGLTEFVPVSSTAHLLISSHLINFNSIQNNLFEIVIQFGAILAIVVVYHKKIFDVIVNFRQKSQQHFILNLILAFLPAAIIGGIFHSVIKRIFFTNATIAIALIVGGILIIIIERKSAKADPVMRRGDEKEGGGDKKEGRGDEKEKKQGENNYGNSSLRAEGAAIHLEEKIENIKPLTAFYIGLFQCIAMIPGVSRSGATIIGGILLGLNRKTATEFSFFLAIPTIAAASFYDLYKNYSTLTFENLELILIGLLTSFFSALLVIKWFIGFVSKNNFTIFGIYRIIVGVVIILFIL